MISTVRRIGKNHLNREKTETAFHSIRAGLEASSKNNFIFLPRKPTSITKGGFTAQLHPCSDPHSWDFQQNRYFWFCHQTLYHQHGTYSMNTYFPVGYTFCYCWWNLHILGNLWLSLYKSLSQSNVLSWCFLPTLTLVTHGWKIIKSYTCTGSSQFVQYSTRVT